MDYSECRITVLYCLYQYSHGKQIIYLVKSLILIDHLSVYAEEMLDTSVYLTVDTCCLYMLLNLRYDISYERFSCVLAQSYLIGKLLIHLRLEILKRQIIKLYLNLRNTKSLCDRSIYIHRLPRLLLLLLWLLIL